MFRAIAEADLAGLEKLSRVFVEGERNAAALLALDHVFSRLPVLESYKLQEMDQFRQYSRLLHQIISHADPLSDDGIKRLFCIREISNTEYGLGLGSFLHSSATGDRHGPMYLQPSVVALSKKEVVIALRKYLADYLRERVTESEENELCCEAVVFPPCLTYSHPPTLTSHPSALASHSPALATLKLQVASKLRQCI
jgi:hypothetical protein